MRYTIETNNGELDTYYDYDISLNYQLNDILDLNSRNTNWSKTIKIPGTPTNNKFFQNIYDVNIDNELSFNPIQKTPAKLKVGDDYVFEGYMQLLNIQETNKDIEYEVSLIGKIGTLFANIGDYTFEQFDLSEYDHQRTQQAVIESWENKVYKNGDLTSVPMGDGYVYPYIKYDENANANYMSLETMYPAFYVRTIVDKMFRAAGFTYTSNFFQSEIFNRLIIPFNGNKLQLDGNGGASDLQSYYYTNVGVSGFTSSNPPLGTAEYAGSVFQGGVYSNGTLTEKEFTTRWGYGWSYGTAGFNRDSGNLLGIDFSDQSGQMLIGDPLDNWQNGFEIKQSGQYNVNINMSLAPLLTNNKVMNLEDSIVGWKSGNLQYRYQLLLLKTDGTRQELDSSKNHGGIGQWGVIEFPLITGTYPYNYYQNGIRGHMYLTVDCPVELNANAINLNAGDKLIIRVGANLPKDTKFVGSDVGGTGDQTYQFSLHPRSDFPYGNVKPTYVSQGTLSRTDNSASINAYMSGNQVIDNTIKQKDFFLSIVKMFNLVVSDNPNKENDLIIEPYDYFYNDTKQRILDWTPKLDEDSLVKITPISELDFNKYRYTYKEDKDFLNEQYTLESKGLIFGEYSNIVNNPFSDEVNEVKVIFSPTPVMELDGLIAPFFTTYNNDEYAPYNTNIRILFWNGLQPWGSMKLYDSTDDFLNDGEITVVSPGKSVNGVYIPPVVNVADLGKLIDAYPQTTMWNDLNNPTDTLEWGRSYKQYFDTDVFAAGTLYEKYHKNLLEGIISPNSKLMECEIVLTPKDMATFDFRDLIYLKETYWRVNEIKNYNPINSDKTTTVVLYKVLGIDLQDKFQVEVPEANTGCAPYIIQKSGNRYYYVNADGSAISDDCCTIAGGTIDGNGRCLANVMPKPPLPPFQPTHNPWSEGPGTWTPWIGNQPTPGTFPGIHRRPIGGIYTFPIEQPQGPSVLNKFNTRNEGIFVKTEGFNNVIRKETRNSFAVGNENTIATNNTLILGNNIISKNEGSIYLQNAEITKYGEIKTFGNTIIDGGEDTVFPFWKTNPTEIIDGTIDSVRNPGAYSWKRPFIDGNGYNNEDTLFQDINPLF